MKDMVVQIDETTLMALADGELDPDEAQRVRALIADDPAAQTQLRRFVESRERLRAVAAQPAEAASDAALIARIRAASLAPAQPAPQAASRPASASPVAAEAPHPAAANRNRAPWAALAAALTAAAVGIGWWQTGGDAAGDLSPHILAALDSVVSGEGRMLPDGQELTVIASYRNAADEFCREFETRHDERMRVEVACRDIGPADAGWNSRFAVDLSAPEGYVPASGDIAGLDDYLAVSGAGAPLTAEEEAGFLRP